MNKREKYRRRIEASLILLALRRSFKLKEIEELTGIPVSLISRYSNGDILPGERHIDAIEKLIDTPIIDTVLKKFLDIKGKLAIGHRLSSDPLILWFASKIISHKVAKQGREFDVIITPEVGGIPLGVSLSQLTGKTLIIARRKRYLNWNEAIAGIGGTAEHIKIYYIERNESIIGKKAIIVDDIVIEGDTMESLVDLAGKAGLEVCCLYSVYGIGSAWKEKIPSINVLSEINL